MSERAPHVESESDSSRRPVPVLTGKQRRWLRGRAHHLAPVVRVGQQGTTAAVLRAIDEALEAHELVKVRAYRPDDKHQWAEELARATGAALCGLIGHTAILYRPRSAAASCPAPALDAGARGSLQGGAPVRGMRAVSSVG